MTQDEVRDLLMELARSPHNGQLAPRYSHSAQLLNPACGDRVEVRLAVSGGSVESYSFHAQGCVLSTASAALAREVLPGLPTAAATAVVDRLAAALADRPDAPWPDELAPLEPFAYLRRNTRREGCVLLAWRAIADALTRSGGAG